MKSSSGVQVGGNWGFVVLLFVLPIVLFCAFSCGFRGAFFCAAAGGFP